jgi:hypothetical protein
MTVNSISVCSPKYSGFYRAHFVGRQVRSLEALFIPRASISYAAAYRHGT